MMIWSQISDNLRKIPRKTQQVKEILSNKNSDLNLQSVCWFLYPEQ